jgi:hypothetical protein
VRQPVDGHYNDVVLDPLDAAHTIKAHDGKGTVSWPSSPAPRQPPRLLSHPSEMATIVRPGLCLDRDGNAGGSNRHRVKVSPTLPRQRVPKPPPLGLERGERALHLVLRAGADSTATSEQKPVSSGETQPYGYQKQQPGDRHRAALAITSPNSAAMTLPRPALPA